MTTNGEAVLSFSERIKSCEYHDDLVISLTHESETRAYPLRVLVWHEIVNDQIGDRAFAVTYCPLCGTAMVFNRMVNGQKLSFGVSGLLYQGDVLMYDRQTESLWSQLGMKCVSGKQQNTSLLRLPSEQMTWAGWKRRYPNGFVLSPGAKNRVAQPRENHFDQSKQGGLVFYHKQGLAASLRRLGQAWQ